MPENALKDDRAAKYAGAIDCDLHPAVNVLLPYFDDYWREMVSRRSKTSDKA